MGFKISESVRKHIRERTQRLRKLSEYIDARSILSAHEFRVYLRFHPRLKETFPRLNHNQRLVLFLNYHLGWGRKTIRRRVKLSNHSFYRVKEALHSYDSIVHPVPSREL
jgi:hypothetical protein